MGKEVRIWLPDSRRGERSMVCAALTPGPWCQQQTCREVRLYQGQVPGLGGHHVGTHQLPGCSEDSAPGSPPVLGLLWDRPRPRLAATSRCCVCRLPPGWAGHTLGQVPQASASSLGLGTREARGSCRAEVWEVFSEALAPLSDLPVETSGHVLPRPLAAPGSHVTNVDMALCMLLLSCCIDEEAGLETRSNLP